MPCVVVDATQARQAAHAVAAFAAQEPSGLNAGLATDQRPVQAGIREHDGRLTSGTWAGSRRTTDYAALEQSDGA